MSLADDYLIAHMDEADFIDLIQESLEAQHEASRRNEEAVELRLSTIAAVDGQEPATGDPGFRISANIRRSVGYALVRLGIPLVRTLGITAEVDLPQGGVLRLRLHSDMAEAPVATAQVWVPALRADELFEPAAIEFDYDAKHFVQLDESAGGALEITLEADGTSATARTPVRLLAYNQWDALSANLGTDPLFETLAVHVLPNHPRVEDVRRAVSETLKKQTGSSSQEGYQAGGERAAEIAKATFEAIQRLGVHYSNPPASSEAFQKVRTPDQILDEKFGTCLDTTCLYAACLEQAGLDPALFVIPGHAFAGVFLGDEYSQRLPPATSDRKVVDVLLDHGALLLVETTMLTVQDGAAVSFEAAQKEALARLRHLGLRSMISVAAARRNNIRPLPSRVRGADGVIEIHHDEGGGGRTVVIGQRRFEGTERPVEAAPRRFVGWQSELLDLSLRNSLLNLRVGGRGGGVRMTAPKGGLKNLEARLAAGGEVYLVAHDQLTELQRQQGARLAGELRDEMLQGAAEQGAYFVEVEEARLKSRIGGLRSKARALEDETGANILHLCLGSVVWTDPDKRKEVRSPLLLLPARLETGGRSRPPKLLADLSGEGTAVNHCLLEKLWQTFQLEVPEIASWRGDVEGADIDVVFKAMRSAVLSAGLKIDVEEDAALALLHFGKFRMWRDLRDHWPKFLEQPLVRHLVENPGQEFVDPVELGVEGDLDVAEAYCPVAHDGSQLEAILAASRGNSFVLEGPPGTGKSQTITNLIANALAHGRRILFVAEKRAALDVVKSRLAKVGLAPYCLDIHDKKSTPLQLREQLKTSLDAQFETDLPAFEATRRELGEVAGRLRTYTGSLHATNGLGLSAWSARQRLLQLGDGVSFDVPVAALRPGAVDWDALEREMRELPQRAESAGLRACHPWAMVTTGDDTGIDLAGLAAAIRQFGVVQRQLQELPAGAQRQIDGIDGAEQLRVAEGLIRARLEGCSIDPDAIAAGHALGKTAKVPALRDGLDRLAQERHELREDFGQAFLSVDAAAVTRAIQSAQSSFFLFRGGRVRKAEAVARESLRRPDMDSPSLLAALRKLSAHQAETDRLRDEVRGLPGVGFPASFDLGSDDGLGLARAAAIAVVELGAGSTGGGHPAVQGLLDASLQDLAALLEPTRALAAAWASMSQALGGAAMSRWLGDRPLSRAVAESLAAWTRDAEGERFLDLARWCRLVQAVDRARSVGLDALADGVLDGSIPAVDATSVLQRSAARASLDEQLRVAGLSRFDGREHSAEVDRFARLHAADSDVLAEVLPFKLLETRPFKPGQRRGKIGELYRLELARKKGGRSIRGLIDEYAEAIQVLTPCVLASPASVAQYLPPGVIDFDLVIFDEASQVPVADAIGAMGRGKAIVVVGDSKQMPPTTFFTGSGSSGEEDDVPDLDVAEDMESILSEAVASGLHRIWLSWHYRSQDEQLIAFSNRFYYESRLASFPAPGHANCTMGVSWHKVEDGVFLAGDQRTNRPEAEAVVAEVRRRAADPVDRDRSIGVVALNLNQADLIRELLEEAATKDPALSELLEDESEEGLFVKNLENVQGDERDVILISVTYAKNQQGRLPMNFGPLNRIGGERRWNVLVTRAKQEVVVFSSIEPEEIKLERVSSMAKGVHHMREYMLLARDGIGGGGGRQLGTGTGRDLHRQQIAERLRAEGFVVEEDIGLSSFKVDLAIALLEEPDRRLLAVLLDGPDYASRRTVQDRDGLPATVLTKLMKWPAIERVWLPQWLAEPERVVEQIRKACEQARDAAAQAKRDAEAAAAFASALVEPTIEADTPESEAAAADDETSFLSTILASFMEPDGSPGQEATAVAPAGATAGSPSSSAAPTPERDPEDQDFVPYTNEQPLGDKDDLQPGAPAASLRQLRHGIDDVLGVEAPVEANRLGRLVARRFGLQRVRQDRIDFILDHVPAGLLRGGPHGRFVWSPSIQPDHWEVFRRETGAGDGRKIDEIAPEEIRNALVYIAKTGMGVRDEDALTELAQFFGVKRLTKGIKSHLESVLEWAVQSGRLRRDGGRLHEV